MRGVVLHEGVGEKVSGPRARRWGPGSSTQPARRLLWWVDRTGKQKTIPDGHEGTSQLCSQVEPLGFIEDREAGPRYGRA